MKQEVKNVEVYRLYDHYENQDIYLFRWKNIATGEIFDSPLVELPRTRNKMQSISNHLNRFKQSIRAHYAILKTWQNDPV